MNHTPTLEELIEQEKIVFEMMEQYWLQNSLFTWQWWLLLALAIIPWFIWWRLVDKRRLFEILTFGLTILFISIILDIIGQSYLLWIYPHRIHWATAPPILPYDTTVMPVAYMLTYQYATSWKAFIKWMIIVGLVYAFIAEPFLKWINVYKTLNWKYYYSFPIYIGLGLLTKWLVEKMRFAYHEKLYKQ